MNKQTIMLRSVIRLLEIGHKIHICIHDLSGFTTAKIMELDNDSKTHSSPFCCAAKNTARGSRRCFACKVLAVKKASASDKLFIGMCPLGLYEIVVPLIIHGKKIGIMFIGNIAAEDEVIKKKIHRSAELTGASEQELLDLLPTLSQNREFSYYLEVAEFLRDYISLIYNEDEIETGGKHWAVDIFKLYVDQNYSKNLQINKLAQLYHLNANYIGRVFKREMGMSFAQYVNSVRIKRACNMLKATDQSIIEISLSAGFDNVTYFNRVFKEITGVTPKDYRKN